MSIDVTTQIHQYLTTAPSSLFAQQNVEIKAHWEGDANLLWRVIAAGEDAVVKLFLDAGQARSRRQFDGHQHFSPRGLAPTPLWADRYPQGLSRPLIVYRWVEGDALEVDDPSAIVAWAEAIATLHATPVDDVRRFSPHPINLDYYWRIEQESIGQIERWLAPSGLTLQAHFAKMAATTETLVKTALPFQSVARPAPVHGDLSHHHTLLTRGQVVLLDWEMYGLGDPAADAARLLQREVHLLNEDQRELWLDRYLTLTDEPALANRIDVMQRLLDVHSVVYLLVGLHQHTGTTVASDLQDALPFLQATLSTALTRAGRTLALPEDGTTDQTVADFIAWLTSAPPLDPA